MLLVGNICLSVVCKHFPVLDVTVVISRKSRGSRPTITGFYNNWPFTPWDLADIPNVTSVDQDKPALVAFKYSTWLFITNELVNTVDPDQTALMCVLLWIYNSRNVINVVYMEKKN
jgi:hypothetical protein